jgi:hypothetical protein
MWTESFWKWEAEAGLQVFFCGLTWILKVKVSRGNTQCSPTGLEPIPHTSVALMAQYLNVR